MHTTPLVRVSASSEISLRFRYDFRLRKKFNGEIFVDVLSVLNDQEVVSKQGAMALEPGESLDPSNIGDRSIYAFQKPLSTESPRSYFAGVRVSSSRLGWRGAAMNQYR